MLVIIGNAGPRIAAGQLGYANPETDIAMDDLSTDPRLDVNGTNNATDTDSGASASTASARLALASLVASTIMSWIAITVM